MYNKMSPEYIFTEKYCNLLMNTKKVRNICFRLILELRVQESLGNLIILFYLSN